MNLPIRCVSAAAFFAIAAGLCGPAAKPARSELLFDHSPQPMASRVAYDVANPLSTVAYQAVLVMPGGEVDSFMWGNSHMMYDPLTNDYNSVDGQVFIHPFYDFVQGVWNLSVTNALEGGPRIFRFLD